MPAAESAPVGVVVAAHGEMAPGLVSAVRLVAGDQPALEPVALPEAASPEEFGTLLADAVDRVDGGAGALVLADLPGATPFNVAARLRHERKGIEVVGGVSLPMLLEVLLSRDGVALADLAELAVRSGTAGVRRWQDP